MAVQCIFKEKLTQIYSLFSFVDCVVGSFWPNSQRKMKLFLILTYFTLGMANRVYIHPFSLIDAGDVVCEVTSSKDKVPLETIHSLTAIQESTEPDPRPEVEELKNLTQWTAVVAELQNSQGLRMFHALSRRQGKTNVLFSPYAAFGTLVTLYLGTSKSTANDYQQFLGLLWNTEKPGCTKMINGHKVLRALKAIGLLIDGPQDELRTLVWSFVSSDADLSKDFVHGIQEFSDKSFIRAVNFSQPKEAEAQVNSFIQKTSHSKVENLFKDISQSTNMLFASSTHFKGGCFGPFMFRSMFILFPSHLYRTNAHLVMGSTFLKHNTQPT